MSLPDLIEIVPLTQPVKAEITVPGSKSITNRALILAALADGEVRLKGALWSEDTQIMVACLQQLGFLVSVTPDPNEPCNRTITVAGENGLIPPGGTEAEPVDLFVGNAGTAARFLAPFLCLGNGVYRLHGVRRMHERPQAALFQALRELGYRIESENGNEKLPVRIFAGTAGHTPETITQFTARKTAPAAPKKCRVSIEQSSQFASALLLSSKIGQWQIEVVGENADESPYVVMTSKLLEVFPHKGGNFQIEPDASSGSYFWAAGSLVESLELKEFFEKNEASATMMLIHPVVVASWPTTGWQIDQYFFDILKSPRLWGVGAGFKQRQPNERTELLLKYGLEKVQISRQSDLGDSIMTAIVLAPFGVKVTSFTDLGRLRVQECERVVALRTELSKCGAKVEEQGDTLTVYPAREGQLHGAVIETYHDHRMAMCFAILGLKIPGIKIKNPACVKKTFPNFFQKLAAPPPHGLGAEIWEVAGDERIRRLTGEDLFAD